MTCRTCPLPVAYQTSDRISHNFHDLLSSGVEGVKLEKPQVKQTR